MRKSDPKIPSIDRFQHYKLSKVWMTDLGSPRPIAAYACCLKLHASFWYH